MIEIKIQYMIQCPALTEHNPNDLVPMSECKTCVHGIHIWRNSIHCNYGCTS